MKSRREGRNANEREMEEYVNCISKGRKEG